MCLVKVTLFAKVMLFWSLKPLAVITVYMVLTWVLTLPVVSRCVCISWNTRLRETSGNTDNSYRNRGTLRGGSKKTGPEGETGMVCVRGFLIPQWEQCSSPVELPSCWRIGPSPAAAQCTPTQNTDFPPGSPLSTLSEMWVKLWRGKNHDDTNFPIKLCVRSIPNNAYVQQQR